MCYLTINHETASAYVEQAQKMALESIEARVDAMHSLTAMQENAIALAWKHGDLCRVGELLNLYGTAYILAQAGDKARDGLAEKYGKEIAA